MRLPTLAMPRYSAGRSGLHDMRYGFPNRQLPAMSASQPIVHGILPPHERSAALNFIPRTHGKTGVQAAQQLPIGATNSRPPGLTGWRYGVAGWREL
jgi:hypothetical protein